MTEREYLKTLNGFKLNGKFVPESALEILLSFVPPDSIVDCRKVCQAWCDIVSRRSFWKQVFENNGLDWNCLPDHTKEDEYAWMVFHAVARHNILGKNLVKNNCGQDGFQHWYKLQNGGDRLVIESPPLGIEPGDPLHDDGPTSAFVTTYSWCSIQQQVDLWAAGLTPKVMKALFPFQLICNVMVGARFDCGGIYCICLCLQDVNSTTVTYNLSDGTCQAGRQWTESTSSLNVVDEDLDIESLRYVLVTLTGKDDRFWAGHYGPKFSRVSLMPKLLTPADAADIPEQQHNVSNHDLSNMLFNQRGNMLYNRVYEAHGHDHDHRHPQYRHHRREDDDSQDEEEERPRRCILM